MSYPILKPNSSWFAPTVSTIKRANITTINIVDSYTHSTTPTNSWDASVAQDGSIMCYVEGTTLTIAGNGSGKIALNEDSGYVFCDTASKDYFKALTIINGANILDTSNATTMTRMFNQCNALTSVDVSNWDTSKVTNMRVMFQQCNNLATLNVSNWDLGEVTDIGVMFSKCYLLNNIDVSNWNLSKVTDMKNMFRQCSALTSLNTTNWDVSSCTTMYGLFDSCVALTNVDVSNWDVSNVKDFTYAFYKCPITTLDVSKWDVSSGEIFNGLFELCESLSYVDVSKWNMSNAQDVSFMFYKMTPMTFIDVSNWDVSNVENFDHMFAHCTNLANLDVSKWKVTNKAKNLSALFHSNNITNVDVSGWDTSNVMAMSQCFEGTNLERIIGLETWDTSNCICFSQMFKGASRLKELDLSNFDTRKAKSDGTQTSSNGSTCNCTSQMLLGLNSLEKLVLGENFTLLGDGTTTDANAIGVIPTPSIEGADGNWYLANKTAYAPADIPNLTAATYYASKKIVAMLSGSFLNAIGLDRLWKHITTKLRGKVDKVDGKGLSTNDYTNYDKEALANAVVDISSVIELVGDTAVSEQIAAANIIYVGPTRPTDENIKVWINTAEEGEVATPVLPRVTTITLMSNSWTGGASPYSQIVTVNTATSATKVDLQPTAAQIVELQNEDIALMAENVDGVVTIYALGGKPSSDITMQALLTEVSFV